MKTIILSISALFGLVMQTCAQVGVVPTPPTPATPQVEVYSNSTSNGSRSTVTTRHKSTKHGKTEVFTETYTTSSPQQGYDDPLKTKVFSKTYAISKNDKINISNIYGSVTVKTWDKNEVKFDADIKAYENSEEEAQKLIDNVNITSDKRGDDVTFKTNFDDKQGNWGRGLSRGKKWRREVKIHITVYLPATTAITLSQQYGNVELPDFYGPTALKVQYGKLVTGDLKNANNFISAQYTTVDLKDVNKATIKQQYGSGLTIASIGDLTLNAQYATVRIGVIRGNAAIKQQYGSGLSITAVDNLDLDAQYASVKVGTVKNDAHIKMQYGSGLSIEQVGNLSLTAQYSAVKIGKLAGTFTAKVQYGGRLTVDQVLSSSKMINLDTEYATVTLGFAANYGGTLNVDTQYAPFKAGENVTAKKIGVDDDDRHSTSKEYSGTIGRGGSSTVKASVRYNSITLK
jgi:hypothetical protein